MAPATSRQPTFRAVIVYCNSAPEATGSGLPSLVIARSATSGQITVVWALCWSLAGLASLVSSFAATVIGPCGAQCGQAGAKRRKMSVTEPPAPQAMVSRLQVKRLGSFGTALQA